MTQLTFAVRVAMVAYAVTARTVPGMDDNDNGRLSRHLRADNEVSQLLRALTALGQERVDERAEGGPLYAEFVDFCWAAGRPTCRELFDLWLAEIYPGDTWGADDVVAAVKALEAKS